MQERYTQATSSREVIAVDGLIMLTGLYAAVSPWVIHFQFSNRDITINNLIVGLALAGLGMALTASPLRMHRLSWTAIPLGIWLIITPWVVTSSHSARSAIIWNNCWVGAVAAVLGLAAAGLTLTVNRRRRR
jgi:apolipoprotein N-acyltransferase